MATGISSDCFLRCIKQIEDISNELDDGWKILEENGASYLVKSSSTLVKLNRSTEQTSDMCENTAQECLIKFEYHVTYSWSYSVPVLCFNAWKPNGTLLTLAEAWEVVHPLYRPRQRDMYSSLTQMDHVVLQKPFLTLHPCQTSHFLGQFGQTANPVLTWLSSVGPAVHLHIPIEVLNYLLPR